MELKRTIEKRNIIKNIVYVYNKMTHDTLDMDGLLHALDNENNSITLYWGEGLEKILKLKNKKDLAIEFVEEISNIYN